MIDETGIPSNLTEEQIMDCKKAWEATKNMTTHNDIYPYFWQFNPNTAGRVSTSLTNYQYYPSKIKPLPVETLAIGKYYRDILNNRLVRITDIVNRKLASDGVYFLVADNDGDVAHGSLKLDVAEGRFYDDGKIEQ